MQKFKFNSAKKSKLNLIKDSDEILYNNKITTSHTELFSNKRIVIEGCSNIIEYQENYIKLKLKKGIICLTGSEFLISSFNEENIDIKGNILTIEFCI